MLSSTSDFEIPGTQKLLVPHFKCFYFTKAPFPVLLDTKDCWHNDLNCNDKFVQKNSSIFMFLVVEELLFPSPISGSVIPQDVLGYP